MCSRCKKLREKKEEATRTWLNIFFQCQDRGDYSGFREVDEHFEMIGNIKLVL